MLGSHMEQCVMVLVMVMIMFTSTLGAVAFASSMRTGRSGTSKMMTNFAGKPQQDEKRTDESDIRGERGHD